MSGRFTRRIEGFTCKNCGFRVEGTGYTDHCPKCLWSMHVDVNPGDRASNCHGMMRPVRATGKSSDIMIEYRCTKCKMVKRVKASELDYETGALASLGV